MDKRPKIEIKLTNTDKAIELIGQTPLLEFKTQGDPSKAQNATIGPDGKVVVDPNGVWEQTGLTGKQLKKASADVQQTTSSLSGQFVIRLFFDEEGTKLFGDITSANIGKQVAIFLDNKIISAPTVQSAITNGEAVITGNFTSDTAKELATRLNSGALPVPIELVSQQNVGASLGKDR